MSRVTETYRPEGVYAKVTGRDGRVAHVAPEVQRSGRKVYVVFSQDHRSEHDDYYTATKKAIEVVQ